VKAFKVRNELLIFVYLPFSLSRYFQVTSYLKSGILIDYAGSEPGARGGCPEPRGHDQALAENIYGGWYKASAGFISEHSDETN